MMRKLACTTALLALGFSQASASKDEFVPAGIHIGTDLSIETTVWTGELTLSPSAPVITIDYGVERAGYPFFEVSRVDGPVQIEVKYSEAFSALGDATADGPFPYAVGLSNAFRVETFNISAAGRVQSSLVQGGQRWEAVTLLAGSGGSVTLKRVGLVASVDARDVTELPGQFDSDDDTLNEIWRLGSRAALCACVEKGTQGPMWQVDEAAGAFIRSQVPASSWMAPKLTAFTLEFDVRIDRGGFWWKAGSALLDLTSEQPEGATFVNTNTTLLPASSIVYATGYGFVNVTTMPSTYVATLPVPFGVREKTWYRVQTVVAEAGWLAVSIDNTPVFNVTAAVYVDTDTTITGTTGAFGLGAWQDQEAWVRNVAMIAPNGTTVYANPLTNRSSVLTEFGVGPAVESACLDGAKRDRLLWLGDFYHTSRIIGASTGRTDLTRGSLNFVLGSQFANGALLMADAIGIPAAAQSATNNHELLDYPLLGMGALHSYVQQTDDGAWLQKTWPQWQKLAGWVLGGISPQTGLLNITRAFSGPGSGSSVSCMAVQGLRQMAVLAASPAIANATAAALYSSAASSLAEAVNSQLWNDELGVYMLEASLPNNYSIASTGFCITAGVADANRSARAIAALESLSLGPGYMDSSAVDPTSSDTNLSPFLNGFLLPALFSANRSDVAISLIRSLWGPMTANPRHTSGASWEYVSPQGEPGLGGFTSLSHPWGGAATYVLTEYIAGIRAADGVGGLGYKSWVFDPSAGVAVGLKRASATIPTPAGLLSTSWSVLGRKLLVNVSAPLGSIGSIVYGKTTRSLSAKSGGRFASGVTVKVQGNVAKYSLVLELE